MAYREVSRVEIAEVVRRWQSGISQRRISTGTGLSRATVRRHIEAIDLLDAGSVPLIALRRIHQSTRGERVHVNLYGVGRDIESVQEGLNVVTRLHNS